MPSTIHGHDICVGSWSFPQDGIREIAARLKKCRIIGLETFLYFEPQGFSTRRNPGADDIIFQDSSGGKRIVDLFKANDVETVAFIFDARIQDFCTVFDEDNEQYLSIFRRYIEICRIAGIQRFIIHTSALDAPERVGRVEARARLINTWTECIRIAEGAGVLLLWEFESGSAFSDPASVLSIAQELDCPSFGLVYDTAHGYILTEQPGREVEGGQIRLIKDLGPYIKHIHIGDCTGELGTYGPKGQYFTTRHVALGSGVVDLASLVPLLLPVLGTFRWATIDLWGAPTPWDGTALSIKYLSSLSGQSYSH